MKQNKYNEGFALPIVLVVVALIFTLSTIVVTQIGVRLKENIAYKNYQSCLLVAKNTMAEVEASLYADPDYGKNLINGVDENGGTYTISPKKEEITTRILKIVVYYGQERKELDATVYFKQLPPPIEEPAPENPVVIPTPENSATPGDGFNQPMAPLSQPDTPVDAQPLLKVDKVTFLLIR